MLPTLSRATVRIRTEFLKNGADPKSTSFLHRFPATYTSFNRYAQNFPSLTRSSVPSSHSSRRIRFAVAGETPRPSHRSPLWIRGCSERNSSMNRLRRAAFWAFLPRGLSLRPEASRRAVRMAESMNSIKTVDAPARFERLMAS